MDFAPSFDDFQKCLQDHENKTVTKYATIKVLNPFSQEKVEIMPNMNVHWEGNIPYFRFGHRLYNCHQGVDKNIYKKRKYAERRDEKACTDHCFTKRYKKIQTTKKLGCPAEIRVIRVIRFPDYKIQGELTQGKKSKVSALLKKEISRCSSISGEAGYFFKLPGACEHKFHLMGAAAGVVEPVDEQIRKHIKDLVYQGQRSATVIAELARVYASTELSKTDTTRRRFFPDLQTIRQLVSQAKNDIRLSKFDQAESEAVIQSLDPSSCNVFFRPCTSPISEQASCSSFTDAESPCTHSSSNNLLFVYQSNEMQGMYHRYGCSTVLLDATYKTCKYAIPVYFVVVQTNVNYQVVCVIITQFETKEALSEGLGIMHKWNENVTPKYAMVDFAAEEIGALEFIFPGIKVFICSFHREQAWGRWLSKSKNADIPREEALSLLRSIANAQNEKEIQNAIAKLKSWEWYEKTALKIYFEKTWAKEIERWALVFKPNDMILNSNNGVERLNEELKYRHLENYKNCMLSELICILVKNFLIERYAMYVRKNLQMSTNHRKYNSAVPEYLLGKAKWLIDHILSKLSLLPTTLAEKIILVKENVFEVQSDSGAKLYTVTFNVSEAFCCCTCPDYKQNRMLCKHAILVGMKFPEWHLCNIQSWLFNNPIYRIDENVVSDVALVSTAPDDEVESVNCKSTADIHTDIFDEIEPGSSSSYRIADTHTNIADEVEPGSSNCIADTHKNSLPEFGLLKLRKTKQRLLINDCNSSIRSIQATMWNLSNEHLVELSGGLKTMFENISRKVVTDESSGLPIEMSGQSSQPVLGTLNQSSPISVSENITKNITGVSGEKSFENYRKLPSHRSSRTVSRVGAYADLLRSSKNIHVEKARETFQ